MSEDTQDTQDTPGPNETEEPRDSDDTHDADDTDENGEAEDTLEAELASSGVVSPVGQEDTYPIAPSTDRQASNALVRQITPVAFWKLEDLCFDFDRFFIKPHARRAFERFATLKQSLPNAPVTLFGHADPIGKDNYNRKLSEKRAKAVYGVLARDPSAWISIYQGDHASSRLLQSKLQYLNHYDGAIDGVVGPKTKQAISDYIDYLAGELRLHDADFLASGKCALQGCGEFNPVRMFSTKMNERLQQEEHREGREIENQPNRRVVAVFFEEGTEIDPSRWPCTPSSQASDGCKKRFWSDWEERRQFRSYPRQFNETPTGQADGETDSDRSLEEEMPGGHMVIDRVDVDDDLLGGLRYLPSDDTFACRFYEHIARKSGCESVIHEPVYVEILLADPEDEDFSEVEYRFVSDSYTSSGTTKDGMVSEWLPTGAAFYHLEWRDPDAPDPDQEEGGKEETTSTEDQSFDRSITVGLGWEVGETKLGLFLGSLEEE